MDRPAHPSVKTEQPALWALLVGINKYRSPQVSTLRGCVNDVQEMEAFLINQIGVSGDQICILKDTEATRDRILSEFRTFLIENPNVKPGDQIVFHYSGHGSRMRCPMDWESSGYVEALVPHDSRTDGIYDIPDRTLAALLDRLALVKGDQITVILDSCHSGSGTRDSVAACVRRTADDDRLAPSDLDAQLLDSARAVHRGRSGWPIPSMPYVLLAGCRDLEVSNEYWGSSSDAQKGVWFGALTFFTLLTLKDMGKMPTRLSYVELIEQVASLVNAVYPNQMPQCEGHGRTRAVFANRRIERDPFFIVDKAEGQVVWLRGGVLHGLSLDTELGLYPPSVRTRADLPACPLGTVKVVETFATTSRAIVVGQAAGTKIPVPARAVITKYVYSSQVQFVSLVWRGGELERNAIEQLHEMLSSEPGSSYLKLQPDPERPEFDLRVVAEAGALQIYGGDGTLLVVPQPITGKQTEAAAVVGVLKSIARYHILHRLTNQDPSSKLVGRIGMRLRRLVVSAEGIQAQDLSSALDPTLIYEPGQPNRNRYVVDVINDSVVPVYPHVFVLNPDYSIVRLYPKRGQETRIAAAADGRPGILSVGLPSSGEEPLTVFLPDQPRWDSCRDHLKVIVTTACTDLRLLEQTGSAIPVIRDPSVRGDKSAINQLLRAVSSGTRFGGGGTPGEDWATKELSYTLLRAGQAFDLPADQCIVRLDDQIRVMKPPGFKAKFTILTIDEAVRGDGCPPPYALSRFPERFQTIRRLDSRGIGPVGITIDIDVDDEARALITPETPLELDVASGIDHSTLELLPIAYDGDDYLFVGHSTNRPGTVKIVELPRPATRGAGQPIRLFIYKKLGRQHRDLGVRTADLHGDGTVQYGQVDPARFQPGQRVALFVHGFVSDSEWMVRDLAPFLLQDVVRYDHLLTYDYESFGTGIRENGLRLGQALRQECQFAASDDIELDIYAHSMGSIVCRSMIELAGGDALVDRLVMAGPPNRGTTLASSGRALLFMATQLLNGIGGSGPVSGANWMLKQIYDQGEGLADLTLDSALLNELNRLNQASSVQYLVLAGRNVVSDSELGRLERLAYKVIGSSLDQVFGEPNDSVIGYSCMVSVRGGHYPRLCLESLNCNHFMYFEVSEGRQAIKRWIQGV